jgi:hypothetical protein
MSSAAAVLLCVLQMLGRPSQHAAAVELIDVRPPMVSANAEAFTNRDEGKIYLLTNTPVFRDAQRGDLMALKKLASIYAHEDWHLRHGADERQAYEAQLTALALLGAGAGTGIYQGVVHAMLEVQRREKRRRATPREVLAERTFAAALP